MSEAGTVRESVVEMYMDHPFPLWTREERHRRFGNELVRYRYLGLDRHMHGARFLDVGCGTGNRSMLAARHFGVRSFVGLDATPASLAVARAVAVEESMDHFQGLRADLFEMPFEDGSFDVVVSWGVLHHTPDPFRGLKEMARVCKPGGFIGVYLYNRWNDWRHNLQKAKVNRLGGQDVRRRFVVAHELYGQKPVEVMTPEEIAVFFDKYCHPHKSDHTLGETLKWFDRLSLEYWGSYPPLRFRSALGALQYRQQLLGEYPLRPRFRRLVELAARLPSINLPEDAREARPGVLHRFLWQAAYAWLGRHGEYSGGAALSARKPMTGGPAGVP